MQPVVSRPVLTNGRMSVVATLRKNFATNLRALIQANGYNQKTFAAELKVSDAIVSKWLNLVNFPEDAMIDRIAGLLGISYEELVKDPSGKPKSAAPRDSLDAVLRDFARIRGYDVVKKNKPNTN